MFENFNLSPSHVQLFKKYMMKASIQYGIDIQEIEYQVIGCLSMGINYKEIIQCLYQGKIGWKHPIYEEYLQKQEEEDYFQKHPLEVEEGVMECGKCKSKYTFSYSKQVRSADEGTTVFSICITCGNKWRN